MLSDDIFDGVISESREDLIHSIKLLQEYIRPNDSVNYDTLDTHGLQCMYSRIIRSQLYKKLDKLKKIGQLDPDYDSTRPFKQLTSLHDKIVSNHQTFGVICDHYNLPISKIYYNTHYPVFLNTPCSDDGNIINIKNYVNMVYSTNITLEELHDLLTPESSTI